MSNRFRKLVDRLHSISIQKRLTIYLLLGLIPIVLITAYSAVQEYRARQRLVVNGHMATATAMASAVHELIDGVIYTQQIMAMEIGNRNMTLGQMSAFFTNARNNVDILENVSFASPNGEVLVSVPTKPGHANVADTRFFRKIAGGDDWTVSDLIPSRPSGTPTIIVAQRVERNGRFAGVLFCEVSPRALGSFVRTSASSDFVGYSILDSTGNVVVTNIPRDKALPVDRNRSWIPSVKKAMNKEAAVAEPFRDRTDGIWRMGASAPVQGIWWVVNVLEQVDSAMASARKAAMVNITVQLLLVSLLTVLAWFIGRRFAEPIIVLAKKADAVARGDFSQRAVTHDRAEIGKLAEAFNNMVGDLDTARETSRKARIQSLFLADIGELLVSTLETDVMLQKAATRTLDLLGDLIIVYSLKLDGSMEPTVMSARNPELETAARELISQRSGTANLGVVGKAIELDKTVFIQNIHDVDNAAVSFYMEQLGAVSSIAVPMKVHGRTVGAFSVSSQYIPLEMEQVALAEEIARRLGLAMENITLYQESVEREGFQKELAYLAAAVSSSLDPKVVVEEICSRSMDLLGADGAYIWVLSDDRSSLNGTASCGVHASEFVGLIQPMKDKGSAAVRAAVRRQAFFLHDMPSRNESAGRFTHLFGAKSSMFVPLINAGDILGVLVVTDTENPSQFDEQSLRRANLVAAYAAAALGNAGIYQRERRIAEALQRGLLPTIPTSVPGFDLAHYYTPAWSEAEVGGDFYDFIDLGHGTYGLAIGDVSGKGLKSAVVTAMARNVLRAYTAEDPEPMPVLARTNNAIIRYTDSELFITMMYGLLNTKTCRFRFGSAGHEPVLIYRAKDKTVSYHKPSGTVAGLIPDLEYLTGEVEFAPGDMMLMYTDGLTDARSPSGKFLGQDGLSEFVRELAGRPAQTLMQDLMGRVLGHAGGNFTDDIAVLLVCAV